MSYFDFRGKHSYKNTFLYECSPLKFLLETSMADKLEGNETNVTEDSMEETTDDKLITEEDIKKAEGLKEKANEHFKSMLHVTYIFSQLSKSK